MPNYQGVWSLSAQYQNSTGWPSPPLYLQGDLGILAGGGDSGNNPIDIIQYIFIGTTGNATDFGDLTVAGYNMGMTSSQTRALFFGGHHRYRTVDYVEMASASNAVDFGDITLSTSDYQLTAFGSSTRAVVTGLKNTNSPVNNIEYFTIATLGDGTDFGDLSLTRGSIGCAGSSTRMCMAGGRDYGTYYNTI
ncbi:MAG: hypothetical protein GY869_09690, partial [Planctomycetes bacterium]|nr:hypothetical protein [Planctomycetota bacterium]